MSSLESSPHLGRRLVVLGALSLGLTGCLRPLYGPTVTGARLQDVLAEIEAEQVRTAIGQERVGHYLRSELIYDLDGSGQPQPKRYRLAVSVTTTVQSPIVDTTFGRANASTLLGEATYTLVPIAGGAPIASGRVVGSASYER